METITSSEEISQAFSCGKRIRTPYLTLIVVPAKQRDQQGRVAFIAGKKQGGAVWRNAAKRRMREICRALGGGFLGVDVIFLAKANVCEVSYSAVLDACAGALERGRIVESPRVREGA